MAYLTVSEFRLRTELPAEDIDWVEAAYSGFLQLTLDDTTAWIEARLFKRYAVPFGKNGAPVPSIILGWLTKIVTASMWRKRAGVPGGDTSVSYLKESDAAKAEIKEAADAVEGLFDLPLRQDKTGESGISRSGPLGYSEASPYTAMDVQINRLRSERR